MADPHAAAAMARQVVELHQEPSALGITAAGYVALSMLVVIGLILYLGVPKLIARMLDAKIASIRENLDEAARLRAEAETLLAEAQARAKASAGDAAAIVEHAEAEAKAMLEKAARDSADLLARRAKMAEDTIGVAEREAVADVRARAAEAATRAAAAIIAERHDAMADRALVDHAIAGLARPN